MNELIDEAIVGVCLDIHRSVKQGVYSVLEQSDEKMLVSSTFALTYFVVHRSLVILRQLVVEERCKGRIVSDFGLRCWSGRPCWVIVLCCVVGQNAVLSECLSPTRIMNGWRQIFREA